MKIYIATSWKMKRLALDVSKILKESGHEVDCFCDDSGGRYVFHFSEIGDATKLNSINFLEDERSQKAFREDKKWLDWADAVVLLLPSGKSAHLEAGYAVGQGKKLYIMGDFPMGEFDVMYGFADGLYKWGNLTALIKHLEAKP